MSSALLFIVLLRTHCALGQTQSGEEIIYYWSADSLTGWNSVVNDTGYVLTNCSAYTLFVGNCYGFEKTDEISRNVPTTGFHSIRMSIVVGQESLDSGDYCFVRYDTLTQTRQTTQISWKNTLDSIAYIPTSSTLPSAYDNDASFIVSLGTFGGDADKCWFDELYVYGTPITPSPTSLTGSPSNSPTPATLTPTTNTVSPSESPTASTLNPTKLPTTEPTKVQTSSITTLLPTEGTLDTEESGNDEQGEDDNLSSGSRSNAQSLSDIAMHYIIAVAVTSCIFFCCVCIYCKFKNRKNVSFAEEAAKEPSKERQDNKSEQPQPPQQLEEKDQKVIKLEMSQKTTTIGIQSVQALQRAQDHQGGRMRGHSDSDSDGMYEHAQKQKQDETKTTKGTSKHDSIDAVNKNMNEVALAVDQDVYVKEESSSESESNVSLAIQTVTNTTKGSNEEHHHKMHGIVTIEGEQDENNKSTEGAS